MTSKISFRNMIIAIYPWPVQCLFNWASLKTWWESKSEDVIKWRRERKSDYNHLYCAKLFGHKSSTLFNVKGTQLSFIQKGELPLKIPLLEKSSTVKKKASENLTCMKSCVVSDKIEADNQNKKYRIGYCVLEQLFSKKLPFGHRYVHVIWLWTSACWSVLAF